MEALDTVRARRGTLFRPEIPWERFRRQDVPSETPSRLLLVVSLYSQPIPNRVETFASHLQSFLSTCSVEGS